jgi:hypothetical protein
MIIHAFHHTITSILEKSDTAQKKHAFERETDDRTRNTKVGKIQKCRSENMEKHQELHANFFIEC